MGVIVDTNVFVRFERNPSGLDLARLVPGEPVFTSAVVASELLVGVHRAKTDKQRERRAAFVEAILTRIPILDITLPVARVHAQVHADLMRRGEVIGSHDLLIAATALAHGHSLLTENVQEFNRIPGLTVIPFA